jgi:hypothetical protein
MCTTCQQSNCGCSQTTITNTNCTCPPETCTCPIKDLSTDCVLYSGDDLACSGIEKNTILTEVIQQLDGFICDTRDQLYNAFTLVNVGGGAQAYKGVDGIGRKEIRTVVGSSLIDVTQNTDDISVSVDEAALNTFIEENQKTYSVTNIGSGSEIYKDSTIVGNNTQFNLRKIKSSDDSVIISQGANDIDITVIPADIPPLQKIDEGNGEGIIIRDRDSFNYISIGVQAIDLGRIEPNNLGFPNVAGAGANYSGVLSGTNGTVDSTGVNSVIGGGRGNYISPRRSGIFSGSGNQITNTTFGANENNSILGGALNYISGEYCVIGGGYQNTIDGSLVNTSTNVLSGGFGNLIKSSRNSSITGGEVNTILNSVSSTITGGSGNNISNHNFGTILGGVGNRTYTVFETVVGIKNTEYTPNNTEQDRLFTIGNGGGIKDNSNPAGNLATKSDALIILKNGLATLPSVTNTLITAASGKAIVTKEFLNAILPIIDGSETKINAGTNVSVTGIGTISTPYIINATDTTYSAGAGLSLIGTTFSVANLQKVITGDYTLVAADFEYTIFINNGATPITITLDASVTTINFCVGFIQEGTADVTFVGTGVSLTNPIGMKSKGQGYQTFIERKLATSSFYLLGNTKV